MSKTPQNESLTCPPWRVRLFGVLRVEASDGHKTVSTFRTRTTGSLLAYLAYHIGVAMPREVIMAEIWPDISREAARNRFNVALSALRVQFSTSHIKPSDVFVGDMLNIALNSAVFCTDVMAFEQCLKRAARNPSPSERLAVLDEAVGLYENELAVGLYEDWIAPERERLAGSLAAAKHEREKLLCGWIPPRPPQFGVPVSRLTDAAGRIPSPAVPIPLTRFFGREAEVEYICAEIERFYERPPSQDSSAPLITLTGIGGIGKSRLGAECARRVRPTLKGRIWFIELADAVNPQQIWVALRDTLGLQKQVEDNAAEQVTSFLSEAPALLVLDNMEQFVESGQAVEFVNALRSRLPRLTCLVTSRHVVGAYGEKILRLGSLLVPAAWTGRAPSPETSTACLQLFADRALRVSPSFKLSPNNLSAVVRLCQALDGIPLAIELAAARSNILSPVQLLEQVGARFALLKSSRRDVSDRHRSLYAAVETSYRMLTSELAQFFRFLSIFRGGWTVEAAVAVTGRDTDFVWDALIELEERSLILSALAEGEDHQIDAVPRFRMLDTLRAFGETILRNDATEEADARTRHRNYFAGLVENAEPHLTIGSSNARPWLDALEADHENLRAALAAFPRDEQCLRFATGLHRFWLSRGYAAEGLARMSAILEQVKDAEAPRQAKALNACGALAWAAGRLDEAEHYFLAALSIYEMANDMRSQATVLNNLGAVAMQSGRFDTARRSFHNSLILFRTAEDSILQGVVLTNLGGVLIYLDQLEEAKQALEEALSIQRTLGATAAILQSLQSLADVALRQEIVPVASAHLIESLRLRRQVGELSTFWGPLSTSAHLLEMVGANEAAATLIGASQKARRLVAQPMVVPANALADHAMETRLKQSLPNFSEKQKSGDDMTAQQALNFAIAALEEAGLILTVGWESG